MEKEKEEGLKRKDSIFCEKETLLQPMTMEREVKKKSNMLIFL